MNYVIDKTSQTPAYIQLYRHFVRDISSGIYPCGSRLPSKRIIAEETGVSVITAEHAIGLLNEEGYVQSRERSGVFVIYKGEDFLGEEKNRGNGSIKEPSLLSLDKSGTGEADASLNNGSFYSVKREPDVSRADNSLKNGNLYTIKHKPDITGAEISFNKGEFPFSVLAKTMRRVMLDYGERILVKSPNHGCPELRGEICHYLARSRGISVEPSQVIVGSGAEYLYGLIAQLFGTGSAIAIEKPSFKKIREVYEAMGIKCDLLTMKSDGIASEELEQTKAQVLHVTPFNSFPSGVTAGISKKLEYLRWAKKRDGILIEDNYDSELTVSRKVEEPLFSMDPLVNVIYLNTFSRTLAPSMRIGYMILPPGLTEAFNRKLGFYSCTVPIFDQFVLSELLKSGDFERHLNRARRRRRRQG